MLESAYEAALAYELTARGLDVHRQVKVPCAYRGTGFEGGFRMDPCVDSRVVVEIKCADKLNQAHKKQLLTYFRLADLRLGFLLNFGGAMMKHGIIRTVNKMKDY